MEWKLGYKRHSSPFVRTFPNPLCSCSCFPYSLLLELLLGGAVGVASSTALATTTASARSAAVAIISAAATIVFLFRRRIFLFGEGRISLILKSWTASPSTPVVPTTGIASPTPPVASPFPSQSPPDVESHHPTADEEGPQLLGRQPCWISRGKIDPGFASHYITTLVHAHIPKPVDSWKEFPPSIRELLFDMFMRFVFTRSEDLPRARVVWESTAQTNLRKSMWEAWDKATKTTGSRDPMAWMDYGLVWLRRDYWESLCHHWATGPWQERSQAAKRNKTTHSEKNLHTSGSVSYATHSKKLRHELECAPTFRELFDRTHKRKRTDGYVSESARTIVETYDRTMTDRYAKGTPQPDLDPDAWVDATGVPRKGRVYDFGESLDTTSVAQLTSPTGGEWVF
ncbi:hypothetical protein Taro_019469 [Colocasia esculenta]|uniref:Uncharacterized protein n=1 Tax=Colocasia esculenta TaxID=4460 RepID=A0A843UL53_COLES|nr:hypothetical protein [Colocasia esculenta]